MGLIIGGGRGRGDYTLLFIRDNFIRDPEAEIWQELRELDESGYLITSGA